VALVSDSLANPAHPKIGIAITTVGRWNALAALLDDLASQSQPPHAIAIAHHDADAQGALDEVVASFGDKLSITTVVSPRGISNGRNAAAATFGDDVEWLCFPNDNTRIDADFLESIARRAKPSSTVCAVQLIDREGARNTLAAPGEPLTRRTVWGAIEAATMIRRRDFVKVGGFDPTIGSGAQTPWQAGEGTDLLLRLSMLDDFSIEWIPDITMRAETEFAHLTPRERRHKIRRYGRGTGYLYRRWKYPAWARFRHVVGGALSPLRKSAKFQPADGLALALGRAEGVFGRVVPGNQEYRAVFR
jgi:hypothetical protein